MITAGIQELVAPELPEWASVVQVRLLGREVGAVVAPVADEWRRRADCGLGPLDDPALLRVLFELPVGVGVSSRTVGRWERGVLAASPPGAVERGPGTFTRLACPAVKVEMVVVRARDWRRGIWWASQYGPFCRRVLVLPSLPSDDERESLELEARLYGIGVVSSREAADGWLVSPAPFRQQRLSSGHWLFQERAYAAMMASGYQGPDDGRRLRVVQPVLQDLGKVDLALDVDRQFGVCEVGLLEFFPP
jgi:hypothetical protein